VLRRGELLRAAGRDLEVKRDVVRGRRTVAVRVELRPLRRTEEAPSVRERDTIRRVPERSLEEKRREELRMRDEAGDDGCMLRSRVELVNLRPLDLDRPVFALADPCGLLLVRLDQVAALGERNGRVDLAVRPLDRPSEREITNRRVDVVSLRLMAEREELEELRRESVAPRTLVRETVECRALWPVLRPTRPPRSMVRTTEGARPRRTVSRAWVETLRVTPVGRAATTVRSPIWTRRSDTDRVRTGRPVARSMRALGGAARRGRTVEAERRETEVPGRT